MKANLPMTIPAELRNEIYSLALIDEQVIYIRAIDGRKWKEPGLLGVSKILRQEASAIYYKQNTFEITVKKFAFAGFSTWWQSLVARLGDHPLKSARFSIKSISWEALPNVYDLVKAAHMTGLQLGGEVEVSESNYLIAFRRFGTAMFITGPRAGSILTSAVLLGRKGMADECSTAQMRARFLTWLEAQLNSKYVKECLNANALKIKVRESEERGRWAVRANMEVYYVSIRKPKPPVSADGSETSRLVEQRFSEVF